MSAGHLMRARYSHPHLPPLLHPQFLPRQAISAKSAPRPILPNPNWPNTSISATAKLDLTNALNAAKSSNQPPIWNSTLDVHTKGPVSHALTALTVPKYSRRAAYGTTAWRPILPAWNRNTLANYVVECSYKPPFWENTWPLLTLENESSLVPIARPPSREKITLTGMWQTRTAWSSNYSNAKTAEEGFSPLPDSNSISNSITMKQCENRVKYVASVC